MVKHSEELTSRLEPLRTSLKHHEIYEHLKSMDDVKLFTEGHVYAVWDFMSLLKALQRSLTCVQIPWLPVSNPATARFINEIVHGEESDVNEFGEPKSHFEMYLDAMEELGADTTSVKEFISGIRANRTVKQALKDCNISKNISDFTSFTFQIIETAEVHKIAAAFTFGREDIIPDMFIEILEKADPNKSKYPKFSYYLDRHIELDGDEHGPLSLKMIEELCGSDSKKWEDVNEISQQALKARIKLWDGITETIQTDKKQLAH